MTSIGIEVQFNRKTQIKSKAKLQQVFRILCPTQFGKKLVQVFIDPGSKINIM